MTNSRIELLRSYIQDDPGDPFNHYALALEYLKAGNHELGKEILSNLLQSNPDYLATYYQLGKLLEQLGEKDRAIEIYHKGETIALNQRQNKTLNELRSARSEIED